MNPKLKEQIDILIAHPGMAEPLLRVLTAAQAGDLKGAEEIFKTMSTEETGASVQFFECELQRREIDRARSLA